MDFCCAQAVLIAAWAGHFLLHAAWGKVVTALGPGLLSACTGVVVTATAAALAYASYKVMHTYVLSVSMHSRGLLYGLYMPVWSQWRALCVRNPRAHEMANSDATTVSAYGA